ncbi:MAG TPA: hypothetical protein VNM87_12840 [Candidatus Udaeobacter sp.]|nr:hypothetical protein [Candidatus Udaeobacter sp.]
MEFRFLGLHPIRRPPGPLPDPAGLGRQIQEEGQVRLQSTGGGGVCLLD